MTSKTLCFGFRTFVSIFLAMGLAIASSVAWAQSPGTYTDRHDFGGTVVDAGGSSGADGSNPLANVTFDSAGNMYGTATYGGPYRSGSPNGGGMVWEVTAAGTYEDLHDFGGIITNADGDSGPDGLYPSAAAVTLDSAGDIFGTTSLGGASSEGVIWEITAGPDRTYKDLHDFGSSVVNTNGTVGPDGSYPSAAGVTFDSAGNLYGTTYQGGENGTAGGGPVDGMVWEITASGTYKDLHDFGGTVTNADGVSGPDGAGPAAGVTFDSGGNMYGTTVIGGANDSSGITGHGGVVWEITAAGTYHDLHDFGGTTTNATGASGPDGWYPFAGVTLDGSGNKYGTASDDDGSSGGMVWEITAAGTYRDLHDFGGTITDASGSTGQDGYDPLSSVTLDGAGNIYGTALYQGGLNNGMIWEITAARTYKDLHDFGGTVADAGGTNSSDGGKPWAGISFDNAGNLYGTASQGGANGFGMVWRIALPVAPTPSIAPNGGTFTSAQSVTITDTLGTASIYYTTNGSTPTTSSPVYAGAITVSSSETVEAIAVAGGYTNSATASATFTINSAGPPTAPTPAISPDGGTFTSAQSVTITDTLGGASIYYTTDGSTPTTSSTKYTAPVTVSANETINAIAAATGYANSAVASAAFIINASATATPTPTISPDGGTFEGPQSVILSDSIPAAAIYYTTDGSTPTTNSTVYTAAITVSFSETISAMAVASGDFNSAVASAAFTISPLVPGAYTDIHDFGGMLTGASGTSTTDGAACSAGVTFDSAGDMFGTASRGGASGNGMVWEISASGAYQDLHDFGGQVVNAGGLTGPDGSVPEAAITFDSAGDMFGTTSAGGANAANINAGMVWEITASGTYKDVHDFGGMIVNAGGTSSPDGASPSDAITLDSAGDIYGTAFTGGANYYGGMAWEITESGTYKDLHDFGGTLPGLNQTTYPDGAGPHGAVAFDSAGNMYGTTDMGGANSGSGLIWEITTSGTYEDLHDFGGSVVTHIGSTSEDGNNPYAGVTLDSAGDLYGTTQFGGPDSGGIVWELTPAGYYSDLHAFGGTVTNAGGVAGPDGRVPQAVVTFDSVGNMFSTTDEGGPNGSGGVGDGLLWEITAAGAYEDLHDFGGNAATSGGASVPDGTGSVAGVTFDNAGNLYGTAFGGGDFGDGMAYRLAKPIAPTPVISPNGGTFSSVQSVTITDALSGTSIYYTTDGTTPTTGSSQYTGPITVSSNETITAIAFAGGYVNSATAAAVFTIYLNSPVLASFNPGLQMISLPYGYPNVDIDSLFGYANVEMAVWNQSIGSYALTPTPPANRIALGQGYWVRFPQAVAVSIPGAAAPTNAPFDISLQAGWNMVGDPFTTSVPLSNLMFNSGSETFAQATSASPPLIGGTVYSYDTASGIYTSATSLDPDVGYWIFAYGATDMDISE